MKPKDWFIKDDAYKEFLIHVPSSKAAKVNPLRIGRRSQKEAISDSEIGADSSPGMVAAAEDSMSEFTDREFDL